MARSRLNNYYFLGCDYETIVLIDFRLGWESFGFFFVKYYTNLNGKERVVDWCTDLLGQLQDNEGINIVEIVRRGYMSILGRIGNGLSENSYFF